MNLTASPFQMQLPDFFKFYKLNNNKDVKNWATASKLYTPSTLNIDLILWHTQLIVCAENDKS